MFYHSFLQILFFALPSVHQQGIIAFKLEFNIILNLHFLALLPLAQHGLPHLAKNNSFQLIVDNYRFFCGMGIDISSLHPPKRDRNFVRNERI